MHPQLRGEGIRGGDPPRVNEAMEVVGLQAEEVR